MAMILRKLIKMNMTNVQFIWRRSMNMNVQIISKETIKPSAPTPDHLRTYRLSVLDQMSSFANVPLVFFYSNYSSKRSDILKKSLSETLTTYYPFAGQVKDSFAMDCNDHGADFIEANVAVDMSKVLEKPDIEVLQQLLPRNPQANYDQLCNEGVVAVQVNHFSCGKMAIGVCIWHGIADASAAAHFVKNWAAIARGATNINNIDNLVVDFTSTFCPNLHGFSVLNHTNIDRSSNFITKRLSFDGLKIKPLTQKLSSESGFVRVSPAAAVSTLIWSAYIAIAQQKQRKIKTHMALNTVNLRKRMSPRLHEQCIGNCYHVAKAEISEEKNITENYNILVREIIKSTRMVDNEYVRNIHEDGKYINYIKHLGEAVYDSSAISFSSLCRFPFYEVDFGWGKPIRCCVPLEMPQLVVLMDNNDGEGIEASVTLTMEDIEILEQDPGIAAYASINPSV